MKLTVISFTRRLRLRTGSLTKLAIGKLSITFSFRGERHIGEGNSSRKHPAFLKHIEAVCNFDISPVLSYILPPPATLRSVQLRLRPPGYFVQPRLYTAYIKVDDLFVLEAACTPPSRPRSVSYSMNNVARLERGI